jgi:peptidoglycan hydrolase CwlO-like protein
VLYILSCADTTPYTAILYRALLCRLISTERSKTATSASSRAQYSAETRLTQLTASVTEEQSQLDAATQSIAQLQHKLSAVKAKVDATEATLKVCIDVPALVTLLGNVYRAH